MKKVIAIFDVSKTQKFEIYFPDIKNKFNYYYEPIDQLHKFDEATVAYQDTDNAVILHVDILDEALNNLAVQLKQSQNGVIELPPFVKVGKITYFYNESDENKQKKPSRGINFSKYWLWSMVSGKAQTFIYTVSGEIYIEIGLDYKWHSVEPNESDFDYIT